MIVQPKFHAYFLLVEFSSFPFHWYKTAYPQFWLSSNIPKAGKGTGKSWSKDQRKTSLHCEKFLFLTFLAYFLGGFQLLDLIIPELKSHVIPYKFKSSHWLRADLVKDFFLQMNFPPMRALKSIRDHMAFKLRYNQI